MTTQFRRDGHKFIPIEIEENNIYPGVLKILHEIRPEWPQDKINFKLFTDGITNKLVACQIRDKTEKSDNIVLVRIYGNKTDLLIDRTAEVRNITRLHSLNLAPEIYGVFKNGLAYEYYPGMTLTVDSVTDVKIAALVAKQMAKMHKVDLNADIKKEPMIWDKIEQFLCLVPEPFTDPTKQTSGCLEEIARKR